MLRRTTIDDVARAAGVSAATVSRALRDDHDLAAAVGLTTIRQPVRNMGRAATERLLTVIDTPPGGCGTRDGRIALLRRSSTRAA